MNGQHIGKFKEDVRRYLSGGASSLPPPYVTQIYTGTNLLSTGMFLLAVGHLKMLKWFAVESVSRNLVHKAADKAPDPCLSMVKGLAVCATSSPRVQNKAVKSFDKVRSGSSPSTKFA